jgi:uncharacterized protein (TIGR02246 family)
MNHLLICTLVLLAASISTANAQSGGEDEQAIRKTIADYVAAFNAKDAKRMLDFQTTDEDGRDPRNGRFLPKRSLSDVQEGFSSNPHLQWKHEIDRVRLITPQVAIVDTTADDVRPQREGDIKHIPRLIAYVLKKVDGSWRIAAVRQSLLPDPSPK